MVHRNVDVLEEVVAAQQSGEHADIVEVDLFLVRALLPLLDVGDPRNVAGTCSPQRAQALPPTASTVVSAAAVPDVPSLCAAARTPRPCGTLWPPLPSCPSSFPGFKRRVPAGRPPPRRRSPHGSPGSIARRGGAWRPVDTLAGGVADAGEDERLDLRPPGLDGPGRAVQLGDAGVGTTSRTPTGAGSVSTSQRQQSAEFLLGEPSGLDRLPGPTQVDQAIHRSVNFSAVRSSRLRIKLSTQPVLGGILVDPRPLQRRDYPPLSISERVADCGTAVLLFRTSYTILDGW